MRGKLLSSPFAPPPNLEDLEGSRPMTFLLFTCPRCVFVSPDHIQTLPGLVLLPLTANTIYGIHLRFAAVTHLKIRKCEFKAFPYDNH